MLIANPEIKKLNRHLHLTLNHPQQSVMKMPPSTKLPTEDPAPVSCIALKIPTELMYSKISSKRKLSQVQNRDI